jgi:hypothetical protein
MNKIFIAVDFDGTLVTHEYPEVGKELPGAVDICKALTAEGHQLILWTMRGGKELQDAVQWCFDRGIMLVGVNKNPTQDSWTQSPKAYASIYIDDAAIGTPLLFNPTFSDRYYVDWENVKELLINKGALPHGI